MKVVFLLSIAYNINMTNEEIIGINIKRLRMEKGKTQEELGKVLDCTHANISDIERGKTKIGVGDLYDIARFLGVDIKDIIETNTMETKPTIYFSHGRGSFGTKDDENKRIKKAQKKFEKFVMEEMSKKKLEE